MKTPRAQKISDTMRKNQANKYGLDWIPASRGTLYENKFVTSWDDMRCRCNNKKFKQYKNYGGRGIKVSDRWNIFAYFFIDMWSSYLIHLKENGVTDTTLDRIDSNKGYSKENCKWSTRKEQQYNRTNTIKIKGKTLEYWAKELKIDRKVLYRRYWSNLPEIQILSKDKLTSGRKKILIKKS
jgi:hypothetical protein